MQPMTERDMQNFIQQWIAQQPRPIDPGFLPPEGQPEIGGPVPLGGRRPIQPPIGLGDQYQASLMAGNSPFASEPAPNVPVSPGPFGMSGDLADSLARAFEGWQPPQLRGNASGGQQFIANLLSGAAQGFSRSRLADIGQREKSQAAGMEERKARREAQQASASEAAKALRAHREILAKERLDLEAENRANKENDRRSARDAAEAAAQARLQAGLKGGAGGDAAEDDPVAAAWGDKIANGEAEFTSVPFKKRDAVVLYMKNNNLVATPKKLRDAINTLSGARGAVDQLEKLSVAVNKARNPARRIAEMGPKFVAGLTQSDENITMMKDAREGFLALIARAAGERGVLTDQDVARARKNTPSVNDLAPIAQKKLKNLRDLFDSVEARSRKSYLSRTPAELQDSGGQDWFERNARE